MDKKAFQNCVPKEKETKDRDMKCQYCDSNGQGKLKEDWKTS